MNNNGTTTTICKILKALITIGLVVSTLTFLAIFISDEMYKHDICFKKHCFDFLIESASTPISIIKSAIAIVAITGTVGTMIAALLQYEANVKSNNTANYISHASLFKEFVLGEIGKNPILHPSSFDVYRLHSIIFPAARNGSLEIGETYKKILNDISNEIKNSNKMASNASEGSFRYNEHQQRMRNVMSKLKINLHIQPKTDYFEIETELFSFIHTLNESFCGIDLTLPTRTYR